MTLFGPEFWSLNGVNLQSHAYNIQTFGGSRSGVPGLRGEDVELAYRPGKMPGPRYADARVITLAMWVKDTAADGSRTKSARKHFLENWNMLKRLFWNQGREMILTRRWDEGSGLITADATVRFGGGLEPDMIGPTAARFTVDLVMANPFFYGQQQTVVVAASGSTNFTNPGDVDSTGFGVEVEFTGALTNPQLTNVTPAPDVWLKAGTSIASLDEVRVNLDPDIMTCDRVSDDADLLSTLSHGGSHYWMVVVPGSNQIQLTQSSGAGQATLKYRPVYL